MKKEFNAVIEVMKDAIEGSGSLWRMGGKR
jgi:hypothetical protein